MITTPELPLPHVSRGRFASFYAYSDETLFNKCGLRVAFTEREGGISKGPFSSLNLGLNTPDSLHVVKHNRNLVAQAFGAQDAPCLAPKQVHGQRICRIREEDGAALDTLAAMNSEGLDALVVERPSVAALMCFADCMPIIIVSPSGRFAMVHAGWRGVINEITAHALKCLFACDIEAGFSFDPHCYNVYIGPYIHAECFEVSVDIHQKFAKKFGNTCVFDETHIDLGAALFTTLHNIGIDPLRIADVKMCTVCENEKFFSYRAQQGRCGRHGAFCIKK